MNELNGPETSRKMAKLLNKNPLLVEMWDEVLLLQVNAKLGQKSLFDIRKLLDMILLNNEKKFSTED